MSFAATCSICLESYKSADEVFSTTCGHIYHSHCFQNWLLRCPPCPQCCSVSERTHHLSIEIDEIPENTFESAETKLTNNSMVSSNLENNNEIVQLNINSVENETQGELNEMKILYETINKKQLAIQRKKDEYNSVLQNLQHEIDNDNRGVKIQTLEKFCAAVCEMTKQEIDNYNSIIKDVAKLNALIEHQKCKLRSMRLPPEVVSENQNREGPEEVRPQSIEIVVRKKLRTALNRADWSKCIGFGSSLEDFNREFQIGKCVELILNLGKHIMDIDCSVDDMRRIFTHKKFKGTQLIIEFQTLSMKTKFLKRRHLLKDNMFLNHLQIVDGRFHSHYLLNYLQKRNKK